MFINRIIMIVLDSCGAGELPDAAKYSDVGSNTLANTAKAVSGFTLPNFQRFGLGNIITIEGIPPVEKPLASYGKMAEISAGKDTQTGHWEMMGLIVKKPFPLYPHGFPKEVIDPFQQAIGRKVLGNKAASGTEIIKELGEEHLRTGKPIVYTSADSVFQIAAHKEIIYLEELYQICLVARKMLKGKHNVARVIARPFVGQPPYFVRTAERRDFTVKPFAKTVLDYLIEAGLPVVAIGKIGEIFAGQGVTDSIHTEDNRDSLERTLEVISQLNKGLIFTNLVDFDMLWGHRNDSEGYYQGLVEVDSYLPNFERLLSAGDCLILTADHGCDPTIKTSTDHSREYVPVLLAGPRIKSGVNLGVRETFADLGRTVADLLGVEADVAGTSFMGEIVS